MKRLALLVPLLSLALGGPLRAAEADWPMFQKDPQHTGQVHPRRTVQKPHIRWKQPVGVAGWLNNPLIAEGLVFISSSGYLWQIPDYDLSNESESLPTDGVYAFDLQTGASRWYAPARNDVNGIAWEQGQVLATGDEGAVWGPGCPQWPAQMAARTGGRLLSAAGSCRRSLYGR